MPLLMPSDPLLRLNDAVWRADALAGTPVRVQATGERALDAELPGGGWPVGALIEILQPAGVHSEWRLLLPALARCGSGAVVLVGSPWVPFAPSLAAQGLQPQRLLWVKAQSMAQRLWSAEQSMRCADVDAALVWLSCAVRSDQLRRLQMAAAEHSKLLFVMRPSQAQTQASPAVLRVHLSVKHGNELPDNAGQESLELLLLKRRGPPRAQPLQLLARSGPLALQLAASRQAVAAPWRARHALDRTASVA